MTATDAIAIVVMSLFMTDEPFFDVMGRRGFAPSPSMIEIDLGTIESTPMNKSEQARKRRETATASAVERRAAQQWKVWTSVVPEMLLEFPNASVAVRRHDHRPTSTAPSPSKSASIDAA